MVTLFVYLLLSFEVTAPRISNGTISSINKCNMEAEEHTAEYLVHRLPDELEELIYIRFALDTDGKFQFVKFVVLIASGMFGEGKMRLDESIKQMGSPGRHSSEPRRPFSLSSPSSKDLVTEYQRARITYLEFRLHFTAACCPLQKHPLPYQLGESEPNRYRPSRKIKAQQLVF